MNAALTQLSRIYARPLESAEQARAAVTADAATLANAFFAEAADSDDVTSVESARDYFEGRLAFLAEYLPEPALAPLRAAFEMRLRAWA